MVFNKTIAIDFDGTITCSEATAATLIPPPRRGAVAVINKWYDDGYTVTINTLRDGGVWEAACREYLKLHGIKYHNFNRNAKDRIQVYGDSRKIAADIYIDDRSLGGIPDNFYDIDRIVRMQIGTPSDLEANDSNCSEAMKSCNLYYTNLKSRFSSRFINQEQTSAIHASILDALMDGGSEYLIIENLVDAVIELQNEMSNLTAKKNG